MLLKQLGRQFGGAGSWKAGLEVERRFLIDSMQVDSTQFALRDGSGLSSSNLVSPQVVRHAPHLDPGAPPVRVVRRGAAAVRASAAR